MLGYGELKADDPQWRPLKGIEEKVTCSDFHRKADREDETYLFMILCFLSFILLYMLPTFCILPGHTPFCLKNCKILILLFF